MTPDVIVLNGGSSSGKTTIARSLQALLPDPWLSVSIDTLVDALPPDLDGGGEGVSYGDDGAVELGDAFRRLESAWMAGVVATASAGARIVFDDVFLDASESQERLRSHLRGLDVVWVGIRCAPEVATARERARGDRTTGMAAHQAESVHRGVAYDLEIDSGRTSAVECTRRIVEHITALSLRWKTATPGGLDHL
ncbi:MULTISPECIES: AAA family ATPase [unclassified Rathayibacter]|uniref:chloramphenicol phosphotransferase CPT family protein n=1 Tax=unclassified Rathayibacter TaxID=2609250 RepID=UPI001FB3D0A8|nr:MULTISPECIES: AAA family ATPase [unclassified Rathayibacter]MCJ1674419.1 chloramphenicol phosphotransferase CPT family protein [Rathayibacter sp. VKM Ac-2929]MCJ1684700.1 chloramphenicol phosphotransferase CPT family protein [Rathayibacter sp. VKM Ac-2928]